MADAIDRLNSALEGRYLVQRELGEGGMATVYLARDLKHDRNVALKVLKPELAAVVGEERFLSEIRTTAGLQHPHILPLHDSGAADGLLYYVMPYIDGETLRERLEREKQLPIDEAVRIASAVAHALQTAHDEGIVHRDIKPANILLSRGEPLVSDFGISIAVGAAGGNRLTETGLSVGTPFYMSPEQATGDQAVGPPSDIYSLAAVLCEMLTGDPPYLGSTAQAVLGQIIAGEAVSVTKKRKSVPANVDAAVRKGLEKLPADRFPTAADFTAALADPGFMHGALVAVPGSAVGRTWKLATGSLSLALLAALGWIATHQAPAPLVFRTEIATLLPSGASWGRQTAISPDGSLWVVPDPSGSEPRLALKTRESVDLTPIPGTEGAVDVTFSPDGQWLLYVVDQVLYKRPVVGGSAIALADELDPARVALDWLDDGTILYERIVPTEEGFREIVRIPENGGEILQSAFAAASGSIVTPVWAHGLPGARGVLVVTCFAPVACAADVATLLLADLETGTKTVVQEGVVRAWFAAPGYVVYVTAEGAVLARSVDPASLALGDATIPLFEGVRVGLGYADMVLGDDGTLLYERGAEAEDVGYELVWVDRNGDAAPVDPAQRPRQFEALALSPDDRFLATAVGATGRRDVWVMELPNGPMQRITGVDLAAGSHPRWTGDGERVVFLAFLAESVQIRSARADGSSPPGDVLMDPGDGRLREARVTAEGEWLVFVAAGDTLALGTMNLETGDVREQVIGARYAQFHIDLSPSGDYVAYASNETGSPEIYVRPFPDLESRRWPVSTNGGLFPVWSRGTNEIFYIRGRALMVAEYSTDDGFRITSRRELFEYDPRYRLGVSPDPFDVSEDGRRILMTRVPQVATTTAATTQLILVQNWFEELERLVGGPGARP